MSIFFDAIPSESRLRFVLGVGERRFHLTRKETLALYLDMQAAIAEDERRQPPKKTKEAKPTQKSPEYHAALRDIRADILEALKAKPGFWFKWNATLNAWGAKFLPGVPKALAREHVRAALSQLNEEHPKHIEFGHYRFRWLAPPLCKCGHVKDSHDGGMGRCRSTGYGGRCGCTDFRSRT